MQRRAAAVSAVVFLLVAAGAYAFIGFAEQPGVDVDADETLGVGETVTVDGTEYSVADVGGGEATLQWTNESARNTATVENNSTVEFRDDDYRVLVENASTQFTLEETLNVSQILADDPEVDGRVTGEDDTRYVRYTNGSTVPLDEYLPTPDTATVAEGDEFPYEGNTTTVSAVESDGVTFAWTASQTSEVSASEGGNVTLGDTAYLAHFPDNSTLALSQDFDGYENSQDRIAYFHERMGGLWSVSALSALTAVLLLAVAYLPSRY